MKNIFSALLIVVLSSAISLPAYGMLGYACVAAGYAHSDNEIGKPWSVSNGLTSSIEIEKTVRFPSDELIDMVHSLRDKAHWNTVYENYFQRLCNDIKESKVLESRLNEKQLLLIVEFVQHVNEVRDSTEFNETFTKMLHLKDLHISVLRKKKNRLEQELLMVNDVLASEQ